MKREIITLARSLGSSGDEIARIVANELGYRYVDHAIVSLAAERAGVPREAIEQAERSRPLLHRVLDAMAVSGAAMGGSGFVLSPDELAPIESVTKEHEAAITEVIRETAEQSQVVIVGHGASLPLAGLAHLLRVFITASPAVRAERISREREIGGEAAWEAIEESDKERADYLKRLYDVDTELPIHYDIAINTDLLSVQEAADLILGMAKS